MTDPAVEHLSPDEAFDLLAHETRFDILRTLNDAEVPLPFSDLRGSVGVRDSGRFNYHLEKLVGRFVRKTDDGYRLSQAGRRVVGAVLSGSYTQTFEADPIPLSVSCQECGEAMETRFDEERTVIGCSSCDFVHTAPGVPPGVLEGWDREEIPDAIRRWLRRKSHSADLGICSYCDGRIDTTVCRPGDDAAPGWFDESVDIDVTVVHDCQRCGNKWHAIVEVAALTHPAVVSFHYDHGIDLRETAEWELDWGDGRQAEIESEDPLRVALPVTLDDETRTFVFDDELTLLEERDWVGGRS